MNFTISAVCATFRLQKDEVLVFNKYHFMWLNKVLRSFSLISMSSLNPSTFSSPEKMRVWLCMKPNN